MISILSGACAVLFYALAWLSAGERPANPGATYTLMFGGHLFFAVALVLW